MTSNNVSASCIFLPGIKSENNSCPCDNTIYSQQNPSVYCSDVIKYVVQFFLGCRNSTAETECVSVEVVTCVSMLCLIYFLTVVIFWEMIGLSHAKGRFKIPKGFNEKHTRELVYMV